MLLRCDEDDGEALRVFEAGQPTIDVEGEDDDVDANTPGSESGLLPLTNRLVLEIDPVQEWGNMLIEAWSALNRLFWDAKLNGVDWKAKLEVPWVPSSRASAAGL